jgi:small-conductance mechanosensitive channel
MSRFSRSKAGIKRACDPRRVVSYREGTLARRTAFDGTLVFAVLAALTIAVLAVIGASFGSLVIVVIGFLGLIGFAAREFLADLGAGALLRFAEPFKAGDTVHLYAADTGDYLDATVIKLGMVHTTFATQYGVVAVPNHRMFSNSEQAAPVS